MGLAIYLATLHGISCFAWYIEVVLAMYANKTAI